MSKTVLQVLKNVKQWTHVAPSRTALAIKVVFFQTAEGIDPCVMIFYQIYFIVVWISKK